MAFQTGLCLRYFGIITLCIEVIVIILLEMYSAVLAIRECSLKDNTYFLFILCMTVLFTCNRLDLLGDYNSERFLWKVLSD
jgi:hypothetical protein